MTNIDKIFELKEILSQIFHYFSYKELLHLRLISTEFERVISNDEFITSFLKNINLPSLFYDKYLKEKKFKNLYKFLKDWEKMGNFYFKIKRTCFHI
jgi:hypothetical protein